jgi:hypothetical protein
MSEIYVECPHCKDTILIMSNEINCAIFRHGTYKENMKQMDSHEKKEICDKLFNDKLIYGCGKPFKLVKEKDKYNAEICNYI